MSELLVNGVVKWFSKEKGYGFIKLPGGGLDVFVHASELRKSGIDYILKDGEKVQFSVANGAKGTFATNIAKVAD